jgi:GT2 family glycosyltransferase
VESTHPFFSVVTPVYDPPVDVLVEMIRSVLDQSERDLELVLVDDASSRDEVRVALRAAAAADHRVRLLERGENGGIVAASQDAVAVARGEFLVLVDHDDVVLPGALATMRAAIEKQPEADYLYSDEDKIGPDGTIFHEFRKPRWSPERLRSHMYTGHLSVMRTRVVREVGGFRPGYDGSQDHDLALRVAEVARAVVHVPEVLYHWRVVPGSAAGAANAKPYAWEAGRRAVEDHLRRVGLAARAERGGLTGTYRVRRSVDPGLLVSVVVATDGASGPVWGQERLHVVEAVRSLLERAGHPRIEVVVVHGPHTPDRVLTLLRRVAGDRLRLVAHDGAGGAVAARNAGALHATGDALLLLDESVEVRSDDLVAELVGPLAEDDVAAVGAHLSRADGLLVSAGYLVADGGVRPAARSRKPTDTGTFAELAVAREAAALPTACLAVRRELFELVGGISETLPPEVADVDLSLKLRSTGRRLVWQPAARLYQLVPEAEAEASAADVAELARRWDLSGPDDYLPGAR